MSVREALVHQTSKAPIAATRPTRLLRLGRLAKRKPLGALSAGILVILVVLAAFAPLIAPYDPNVTVAGVVQSPSMEHPLGTDPNGRDMLSRLVFGARVSIFTGFVAVSLGTAVGLVVGLVSGYVGGATDLLAQRVIDVLMAIPGLVLALMVIAVLGPSTVNAALAIALLLIPGAQRITRGSTLSVKESQFVEAARASGASPGRVVFRHLLPNILAPVITVASVTLGSAIIIEASLSFLGLGTQPPTPSWGVMLSGPGRAYMEQGPFLAIFPILAISSVVLSFNLFGDALRDVLDPRLRQ